MIVKNIWYNPRTTVPENGDWIICYEEGGYPRLSNHGILSGTTKWAFVEELLKAQKVSKEEDSMIIKTRLYRDKNTPDNEGLFFASMPFFSKISKEIGIEEGDKIIIQIVKEQ